MLEELKKHEYLLNGQWVIDFERAIEIINKHLTAERIEKLVEDHLGEQDIFDHSYAKDKVYKAMASELRGDK